MRKKKVKYKIFWISERTQKKAIKAITAQKGIIYYAKKLGRIKEAK